jgi:flagellar basal-body rod modification protein FlgD
MQLAGGNGAFGIDLAQPADEVKVTIQDSSGATTQVMNLGAQAAGSLTFGWDGKAADGSQAADGSYKISVEALRGGEKVDSQPLAIGMVQGVSQDSQGARLNVGPLGTAAIADVKQIF